MKARPLVQDPKGSDVSVSAGPSEGMKTAAVPILVEVFSPPVEETVVVIDGEFIDGEELPGPETIPAGAA
jgi:hypothetical protein